MTASLELVHRQVLAAERMWQEDEALKKRSEGIWVFFGEIFWVLPIACASLHATNRLFLELLLGPKDWIRLGTYWYPLHINAARAVWKGQDVSTVYLFILYTLDYSLSFLIPSCGESWFQPSRLSGVNNFAAEKVNKKNCPSGFQNDITQQVAKSMHDLILTWDQRENFNRLLIMVIEEHLKETLSTMYNI